MKTLKTYAIIYFKDKKPIKCMEYKTASRAYFDYINQGCIYTELYDQNNIKLSTYKL